MQPFVDQRGPEELARIGPSPRVVDVRRLLAAVTLAIFVIAGSISGFLFGLKWGFLALCLTSGIASYLIGAE